MENGIDFKELQDAFEAFVIKYSGFPDEHVFWAEGGADVPRPRRPFISMVQLPPESPLRATDSRNFLTKEYWRLEVLTADSGTDYEFEIAGTTYSHTAGGGDDQEDIRDALVTASAADPNATVSAAGTASLDIQADVAGVKLKVDVMPSETDISRIRYRGGLVTQTMQPVTTVVEVALWARIDPDVPTADTTAAAHIARLCAAFRHEVATLPMRQLGHIPKLITSMPDLSSVLRDESENITRIDVEVETTMCHTEFGDTVEEMSVVNNSPQLP